MRAAPDIRIAVLDANSIIGLAKADCFAFLPRIFDAAATPPAVVREITDPRSRAQLVSALGDWLTETAPTPGALNQVPQFGSEADRQALALALDRRPSVILTGDRQLTRRARLFGILCINPPQVVQALAEASIITVAKPHLDQMIRLGFGIPDELYQHILTALGE